MINQNNGVPVEGSKKYSVVLKLMNMYSGETEEDETSQRSKFA